MVLFHLQSKKKVAKNSITDFNLKNVLHTYISDPLVSINSEMLYLYSKLSQKVTTREKGFAYETE